jgi:histone deacetylase complex regulatory component SIN3
MSHNHTITQLLAGRRELILGFNAFLPPDYRIESHMLDANNHLKRGAFGRRSGSGHTPKLDVTDVDSAVDDDINNAAATSSTASTSSASPTRKSDSLKRASSNDNSVATDFVASVKSRLDSATFKQFLAAIGDFNDKRATREETLDRVNALLAGHTDLIRDFKLFLPKSRSNSKQHAEKPASLLSVPAAEKKSRRRSMEHKPSNSVTPTLRKAHAFLHRIETEFPSDQRVAEKFVSLVRGFQQQERSARDFFEKTSVLLTKASGQESDIVDELMLFFPSQMELLYTALDGPGPTPSPPAHRGRGATLRAPRTTSGEYDTRQRSPEARSRTLKAPKSRGSEEATVKRKDKEKPAVAENKEKEKEKESTPKKAVATATAAPAMSPVSAVPANMAKEKTLTRLESTRS